MSDTAGLAGFLVLGLLGGFGHCVGMCSPFVLFVSRRFAGAGGPTVASVQFGYHSGRVLTYASLGAIAGALGGVVELTGDLVGIQRAATIVAGSLLLLWGLTALLGGGSNLAGGHGIFVRVNTMLRGRLPGGAFATGLLLGLLPCGLVYTATLAAVARGSAVEGAIAMVAFGAGTVPALLGISLADGLIADGRPAINRVSQVFVMLMGAWFVWAGFR